MPNLPNVGEERVRQQWPKDCVFEHHVIEPSIIGRRDADENLEHLGHAQRSVLAETNRFETQ